jgi:hypothetical protein
MKAVDKKIKKSKMIVSTENLKNVLNTLGANPEVKRISYKENIGYWIENGSVTSCVTGYKVTVEYLD